MILVLLLVIVTLWVPKIGSIIFISVAFLLNIWIFITNLSKIKVKNETNKYTNKEVGIIEKYHIFFKYPVVSRTLSRFFAAIQISIFILVPYLLFKGFYVQAIIIAVNYFIAGYFAVILNPQFYLHDNLDKNKIKDPDIKLSYIEDMKNIDSALEKMYLN